MDGGFCLLLYPTLCCQDTEKMLVFLVAVTKYRTKATSGKRGSQFEVLVHHGGEAVEQEGHYLWQQECEEAGHTVSAFRMDGECRWGKE